ncbi:MAG: WbuC family cupin fold metalloprotein [Halobacteriovoraceae bacterium]|jgi:cupin fold WbuC family metalloprotein|nr:WbuC family cupin fold metalloprotein [Halobacteriovoraceae bacterium]MBT5094069.1 WbuC family cupin fold metalloprotein [Halobacteriovoraceae bacterium]
MSVEFNTADLVEIGPELIAKLKAMALDSPLKRARYCLHRTHGELIQEMVIALHRDSYVRPHRHPILKSESYHLIEGQLDVLVFNSNGSLKKRIELAPPSQQKSFLLRIMEGNWHMPLAQSEWVIYHEILEGPFNKQQMVEYADWAAAEDHQVDAKKYLSELRAAK